jgi:acetyltransferase-like isoleucine patch superfamily enzyme
MALSRYKLSFKKALVYAHNQIHKYLFFFILRSLYLNIYQKTKIGKNVAIHNNVYFFDFSNLDIGQSSTINNGCYIDNRTLIKIGENVNISHDCKVYTNGHDLNDPHATLSRKSVIIGDDCWLFPNVQVMPGVNLGKGSVIYPGSIVTKDVEDFSIVGGNPAKHIKYRNKNIEYVLDNRVWFLK